MLPRSAVEFGAMGPPNEDALTHTELGYVQEQLGVGFLLLSRCEDLGLPILLYTVLYT